MLWVDVASTWPNIRQTCAKKAIFIVKLLVFECSVVYLLAKYLTGHRKRFNETLRKRSLGVDTLKQKIVTELKDENGF